MSGAPTIVVHFGDAVSSADQSQFLVELDDVMNVDADGEVKTQFYPGDNVYFRTHYDHARMVVKAIKATAGEVVWQGVVTRDNVVELLFEDPDEPVELPHTPSDMASVQWYGRESSTDREGRALTAATTPCLGDIGYQYAADLYCPVPPPIGAAEFQAVAAAKGIEVNDAAWPIAVVIYVEAGAV